MGKGMFFKPNFILQPIHITCCGCEFSGVVLDTMTNTRAALKCKETQQVVYPSTDNSNS